MAQPRGGFFANRYIFLGELGSGGMGTVYRARDTRTGRLVAIKVLHRHLARDPGYLERFRREAKIALALDSRHIVQVLDFGHEGESHYLVMEYVEGASLRSLLRRRMALAPQEALLIAIQVARALEEAHSKNVVHRDIKPENVMVAQDGSVKVADFGVAKAEDYSSLTITGALLGTVQYMAPEFLRGQSGPSSDIYSLGIVLYQMLAGVVPFEAETPWHVMRMHVEAQPAPLTGEDSPVSPEAQALVMCCLAKEPSERFSSAFELRRSLERLLDSLVSEGAPGKVAAMPAGPLAGERRIGRPAPAPLAASVGAIGGMAAAMGGALRGVATLPVKAIGAIGGALRRLGGRSWRAIKGPSGERPRRAPTTAAPRHLPGVRFDLRIVLLAVGVAIIGGAVWAAYEAGSGGSKRQVVVVVPTHPAATPTSVAPALSLSGKLASVGPSGQLLLGDMRSGGYPTVAPAGDVAHPSWSPTGDRVAFVSVQGAGPAATPGDLNVLDVSRGSVTTVVRPSLCEGATAESAVIHNPRWWPDGSALLYQEDCPDPVDSRLQDRVLRWHILYGPIGESKDDRTLDLTEFGQLLGEPINVASFDVSPIDGSIAFELECRNRNCIRLALLDPGGFAGRARILKEPQTDESYGSPTWSPDGSRLAYYYRLDAQWHLRVWDLRSKTDIDLAEIQASKQTPAGYWATITWSPDGAYIAYQNQDAIWVIEAKSGAKPERLGAGNYPSWSGEAQPVAPIVPPALSVPTPTLTPTAIATRGPTDTPTTAPTAVPTDTPTPRKQPPARTPTP